MEQTKEPRETPAIGHKLSIWKQRMSTIYCDDHMKFWIFYCVNKQQGKALETALGDWCSVAGVVRPQLSCRTRSSTLAAPNICLKQDNIL